jgi:hypothetical protein
VTFWPLLEPELDPNVTDYPARAARQSSARRA